jgi:Flp pilus assembly protein TadD
MRIHTALLLSCLPLLLTACPKGMGPTRINNDEIFDSLPGPEVDGMEGTLLKNALVMEKNGEYAKAMELYKQLVELDSKNDEYLFALATNLRRTGDMDNAAATYELLLKRDPANLKAREGQGLLYLYEGNFEKAGTVLTEVHKKDKKRWRTLNGLGILFVQRGMYDEAIAYFKEATKYSERNVTVLNNVGLTHAINKNPDKALAALNKAVDYAPAKSPMKRRAELNLAMVMGINGDMDTAKKLLQEHLPETAVANNLGLFAYLAKDETMAKSYLNMALASSPYHYKRAWENLETITQTSDGKNNP